MKLKLDSFTKNFILKRKSGLVIIIAFFCMLCTLPTILIGQTTHNWEDLGGGTFGWNPTLTGAAGDVTLTGDGGTISDLPVTGITTLTVSGNVTIGQASIVTDATQIYSGTVTLASGVTLQGTDINFSEAIEGGGNNLSVTNSGTVTLTGLTNGGTLSTSGATVLSETITTTGNQNYNGTVTLANGVTLQGTDINFSEAIEGGGNNLSITNSGTVTLTGLTNGGTLSTSGATVINDAITTTGNQNYSGTVTLGGAYVLNATNGNVTINVLESNGYDVDVRAGNNINVTTLNHTTATNLTFIASTTTIGNGAIDANKITIDGGLALSANTTITSNFAGAEAIIITGGITGNTYDLTLNTTETDATIVLNSATNLGNVTINSTGVTTFSGGVFNTASLIVTAPNVTFTGGNIAAANDITMTLNGTDNLIVSGNISGDNVNISKAEGGITAGTGTITADNMLTILLDGEAAASVGTNTALLKTNAQGLDISTQTGLNTGNIFIDNAYTGTLGLRITTNGNRTTHDSNGNPDGAVVVIKTAGAMKGTGTAPQIDAMSATLEASGTIDDLSTDLAFLSAETMQAGSIAIENNSTFGVLTVTNFIAREYGNQAMVLPDGSVKVVNTASIPVVGTQNASLTSNGNILLGKTVSAPGELTITTTSGTMFTSSPEVMLIGNGVTLAATTDIGSLGFPMLVAAGTIFNATTTDGDIIISGPAGLPVGTVTTGAGDIKLDVGGNLGFTAIDSKITTGDGNVFLNSVSGGFPVVAGYTGDGIIGDTIIFSTEKDIASPTVLLPITATYLDVATDTLNAAIYLENKGTLTDLIVTTEDGIVNITGAGAPNLSFDAAKALNVVNGTNTYVSFENVTKTPTNTATGNIVLAGLDLGAKADIVAGGGITQTGTNPIVAGKLTISSGTNLGTTTTPLLTEVDTLYASSKNNGIFVEQNGDLVLNASAQGAVTPIQIDVTGNLTMQSVVSAQDSIYLKATGNVLSESAASTLSGKNALTVIAGGAIGSATLPLKPAIAGGGNNGEYVLSADGDIFVDNYSNVTLTASTNNQGNLVFKNKGNIELKDVLVGVDNNITLEITSGNLTSQNGVVLTAKMLDVTANSISGYNGAALNTEIAALRATTKNGALNIDNSTFTDVLDVVLVTANGDVSIATGGDMGLGAIIAESRTVTLQTPMTSSITDERTAFATTYGLAAQSCNVKALTAALNTGSASLTLCVTIIDNLGGGTLDITSANLLMTNFSSLAGGLTLTATDIIVLDDATNVTLNNPVKLTATCGNIVFQNPASLIDANGQTVEMKVGCCLSLPEGESGVMGCVVPANIENATGIFIEACKHIGVNTLQADTVSLTAMNGFIVDLNGAGVLNITADTIFLTAKAMDENTLHSDITIALAEIQTRNGEILTLNSAIDNLTRDISLSSTLENEYNNTVTQCRNEIVSLEAELNSRQVAYDDAFLGLDIAQKALSAANLAISILEVVSGAMQAVPIVGDGGAAAAVAAAAAVLEGLNFAIDVAVLVMEQTSKDLEDVGLELATKRAMCYSDEQTWNDMQDLLAQQMANKAATEAALYIVRNKLYAATPLVSIMDSAYRGQNPIGNENVPLAVQTGDKGVTAIVLPAAQASADIYLESPADLTLGAINTTAPGSVMRVDMTSNNNILLKNVVTAQKEVLFCGADNITAEPDGRIVTETLALNATGNIGAPATDNILTSVAYLAAYTDGDIYIDNTSAALTIDAVDLTKSCGSLNRIEGVTNGNGNVISVITSDDMLINNPIINNNATGEVRLVSINGSIEGADIANHISTDVLTISVMEGIGTENIPMRTHIATLNAPNASGTENIYIEETDELTINNVVTQNDVHILANGTITVADLATDATNGHVFLTTLNRVENFAGATQGISAKYLNINAVNGVGDNADMNSFIHTAIDSLDIFTERGSIYINEDDNLTLQEVVTLFGDVAVVNATGDILIYHINANGNNTTIELQANNGGNIYGKSNNNLEATHLVMEGYNVGTTTEPLMPNVDHVAINAGGSTYLQNRTGDLTVTEVATLIPGGSNKSGLTSGEDIVISTPLNMVIEKKIESLNGNVSLTAVTGTVTGSSTTEYVGGNEINLQTYYGIGADAMPIYLKASSLEADVEDRGDIYVNNEDNALLVQRFNTNLGTLNLNVAAGAQINTPLNLTGNADFTGNIQFGERIAPNGFLFNVNGDVVFDNAIWEANTTQRGENDKMTVTGSATITNLTIEADLYMDKYYDVILGGVSGVGGTTVTDYTPSVEGSNLRITAAQCGSGTIGIKNLCWMTENLSVASSKNLQYYDEDMYPDAAANFAIFGGLYTWEEATANGADLTQGICPAGYRLPNKADFEVLFQFRAEELKSADYWLYESGSDILGFAALPAGYYDNLADRYDHLMGDAYFWVFDTSDTGPTAKVCHICFSCPELRWIEFSKKQGASIRCIKN